MYYNLIIHINRIYTNCNREYLYTCYNEFIIQYKKHINSEIKYKNNLLNNL